MNCPSCGHENRDRAKFCEECAAPFRRACESCGTELRPGAKFCDECGQAAAAKKGTVPLSGPDAGSASRSGKEGQSPFSPAETPAPLDYTPKHLADKILTSKSALEGERKQVTVLFADVKGSMDLAEQVDPEEWHKILNHFFEILADGIHRFEGTINQYTGDGIMALFGAPITHEDHAQRACYAVLYLRDELRRYAEKLKRRQGLTFAVRMGINSGEVVVGKIGNDLRMDYTAQGHTVGLAARLEQLADPGKIYVSEHTAKIVGGFFRMRDLGPFELKGVRGDMHVFELEDVGEMRTRLDMSRARGLSPFVGRAAEMEILETALARSIEGNAQVIGIVAEAGLGKSRLCHEFIEKCRAKGLTVNQAHGVPHGQSIPFYPVLQMLRGYFGIGEHEPDKAVREKIAGKLILLDEEFKAELPLIFDFLGVPDPNLKSPLQDPEGRQRQLFGVVRRLIHAESAREAGVILAEDLHWIDSGSEAFLATLIDATPGTRGLVIVNFRPDYRAEWMKKSYYQQIPLQPLSAAAIQELLQKMLGDDASLKGLAAHITGRTAGNPYFIEEVVQSLVEGGALVGTRGAYRLSKPVGEVAVPATVQALLAARIDRLPEREKQLLQTASVVGREFSEKVLGQVADLADIELEDSLRKLVSGEFIYEASLYPEREYAFKHALTQEVVYNSQLSDRRARAHGRVAQAIAESDSEKLEERAALIAHHWEIAGDKFQAAMWHARAAAWVGVRDPAEALKHWRQVCSLLNELPESDESANLGLMAHVQILGLGWRQGMSKEELDSIYSEGKVLAGKSGNAYMGTLLEFAQLTVKAVAWGDTRGALNKMTEVVRLAAQTQDEGLQLVVDTGFSFISFLQGRVLDGIEFADRAIARAPANPRLGWRIAGLSPYIQCFGFRASGRSYTGRFEEAIQDNDRGLQLAQEYGDTEILGWLKSNYTWIELDSGKDLGGLSHAHQALEIAEKSGSGVSRVIAGMGLGIAHLVRGEWKEAKDLIEPTLTIARTRRVGLMNETTLLTFLAAANLELGELDLALETVEEALRLQTSGGNPLQEPLALVTKAKILRLTEGAKARQEMESILEKAAMRAEQLSAVAHAPLIHRERAELARLLGDEAGYKREMGEALRLYKEMKADGHVERLEKELGIR